jgi:hypothetical protein
LTSYYRNFNTQILTRSDAWHVAIVATKECKVKEYHTKIKLVEQAGYGHVSGRVAHNGPHHIVKPRNMGWAAPAAFRRGRFPLGDFSARITYNIAASKVTWGL